MSYALFWFVLVCFFFSPADANPAVVHPGKQTGVYLMMGGLTVRLSFRCKTGEIQSYRGYLLVLNVN